MEVILLERIEKLGQMGDVVNVKPGYARNYLLPRKKALRASESSRVVFEQQRTQLEAENVENRTEAERLASDMNEMTIIIVRQASDSDQLYGSVTTRDISSGITEAGVTVDRHQVKLPRPIKIVGLHPVRIDLHPEVSVEITANVARSTEEAEMQARGERINRDGDVIDTAAEEAAIDGEEVFEDSASPDAAELTADAGAEPAADTGAEPAADTDAEHAGEAEPATEEVGTGDAAADDGDADKPAS